MNNQDQLQVPRTCAFSLKGKKILVVDDIVENQMLESIYLRKAGAVVELASNGLEAVEKAMDGCHDAVLMDLHMPFLDGISATIVLRERGFLKPIIAVTADVKHTVRDRADEVGFSDFLGKPLQPRMLMEVLERLLTPYTEQFLRV